MTLPLTPFAILSLSSFVLRLPPDIPKLHNPMALVDNKESCALCYECIADRDEQSVFCSRHLGRIRELTQSENFSLACLVKIPLKDIKFMIPSNFGYARKVREQYRLLMRDQSLVWVTDILTPTPPAPLSK